MSESPAVAGQWRFHMPSSAGYVAPSDSTSCPRFRLHRTGDEAWGTRTAVVFSASVSQRCTPEGVPGSTPRQRLGHLTQHQRQVRQQWFLHWHLCVALPLHQHTQGGSIGAVGPLWSAQQRKTAQSFRQWILRLFHAWTCCLDMWERHPIKYKETPWTLHFRTQSRVLIWFYLQKHKDSASCSI